MNRVVIIGCGYVGTALALRWRDTQPDLELRVTTRSVERCEELGRLRLAASSVDLGDLGAIDAAIEGARTVVFSAASGHTDHDEAVYARGTDAVAKAGAKRGAHLVYTSSTGVYAADDGSWVDEDSPLAPAQGRVAALRSAEQNIRAVGGAVLRLSGIVGPGRGPQRRLEAMAGTERHDGDAWLNLVPVSTIVDALCAVIERTWSGTVNVSGAIPYRRRAFYDPLIRRAGLDPIRWVDAAAGATQGRRIAVRRLREELGVEPQLVDPDAMEIPRA